MIEKKKKIWYLKNFFYVFLKRLIDTNFRNILEKGVEDDVLFWIRRYIFNRGMKFEFVERGIWVGI